MFSWIVLVVRYVAFCLRPRVDKFVDVMICRDLLTIFGNFGSFWCHLGANSRSDDRGGKSERDLLTIFGALEPFGEPFGFIWGPLLPIWEPLWSISSHLGVIW